MPEMLDRIARAAAAAKTGPLAEAGERQALPPLPDDASLPPGKGRQEHVARFRAELESLTGKVYGPFAPEGVAKQVLDLLAERGIAAIVAWKDDELACPGLADALRAAGISLVGVDVPGGDGRRGALERLAAIPAGLTGALAGLADTGSIVVASGRGRSRLASLLPPLHVAVLPVARLYPTMAAWLADGGAALVSEAANVVAITGPSRTADIELTIALGVHGPREVHVVLLGA